MFDNAVFIKCFNKNKCPARDRYIYMYINDNVSDIHVVVVVALSSIFIKYK